MTELTLQFKDREEAVLVLGSKDSHVRMVREAIGVKLIPREQTLHIEGDETKAKLAERVFVQLKQMAQQGPLTLADVKMVIDLVQSGGDALPTDATATAPLAGRSVRPRTDGQAVYVRAMKENDVTLCYGPAGTGKTYLAVAIAVHEMKQGKIKRIVLCRPAVEAGERLG
jgi:phosphate starvation-inducible PhoH-like protein